MNKKIKTLITLGIILTLGVGFGIYKLIDYQIKLYNTVVFQAQRINVLDEFLTQTFKPEVEFYIQTKSEEALLNNPAIE